MNLTQAERYALQQLLWRVNDDLMRADRALKVIAQHVDRGDSDELLPNGIHASRPSGEVFAEIGAMLDRLRAVPVARCGSSQPHGPHASRPSWCAGNVNVIEGQ